MGQKVARVSDSVSCSCLAHKGVFTGTIQTGSNIADADTLKIARLGDTGTLTCGHTFSITSASSIMDIEGIGVARIGDTVLCVAGGTGVITSGSNVADSE